MNMPTPFDRPILMALRYPSGRKDDRHVRRRFHAPDGGDGESVSPVARATLPASTSGRTTSPPSQHVDATARLSKLDPHEPLIDLEEAAPHGEKGADVSEVTVCVCEHLGCQPALV